MRKGHQAVQSTLRLIILLAILTVHVSAEEPFSDLSFDKACKKAAEEKKIVMVDFYTVWCGPCKMLDRNTWSDQNVIKVLNRTAISLKIDAEANRDLAAKYSIRGYPTIVFLKPDGTVISSLLGYRSPDRFLTEAQNVLGVKPVDVKATDTHEGGGDPAQRQHDAKALVKQGRYNEALEAYLWCFDHGNDNNLDYAGDRLSTLLMEIAGLGQQYPPAMRALEKRRDAARLRLFPNNPGNTDIMQRTTAAIELSAINDYLNNPSQTLEAYDLVKKEGPASELIYKAMFHRIDDLLLNRKRYADFIESDKAALAVIDDSIVQYNRSMAKSAMETADRRAGIEKSMKSRVIDNGSKYYEAALGIQKSKLALRIARKLTRFDGSKKTFELLINHARRVNKPDAVQSLLRMAEESLPPEEYKTLSQAYMPHGN